MKNPKETPQQKKETPQSPKPTTKPAGHTSTQKPGQPGMARPETPKR